MRKFKISVLLKLGFYCLFLSIGLEMQARKFVHPGILHTTKSIERMRAQIADKEYPAYGSFELLKSHHCSQADYQPFGPFEIISRDGEFRHTKSKMEQDFYGKEIVLHFTEKVLVFTSNTTVNKKIVKTTLDEIFKFVSLRITGVKKVSEFRDAVSSYQPGYFVDEQDALRVRNKFEQSGLIESYLGKDDIEMIRLTDLGRDIMNELN
jgi:hypothetical protein